MKKDKTVLLGLEEALARAFNYKLLCRVDVTDGFRRVPADPTGASVCGCFGTRWASHNLAVSPGRVQARLSGLCGRLHLHIFTLALVFGPLS